MIMASRWLWRARRITAAEIRLIAEAQLVLVTCQIARWLRPTGRLLTSESEQQLEPATRPDYATAARIGWAVTRAARYGLFRPKCLVRSLAVQRMLRRRGIEASELRIGVRLDQGALAAHAWVELGGAVVGDTVKHVRTFTPVTDFRMVEL